jgi:hypothetical protein
MTRDEIKAEIRRWEEVKRSAAVEMERLDPTGKRIAPPLPAAESDAWLEAVRRRDEAAAKLSALYKELSELPK